MAPDVYRIEIRLAGSPLKTLNSYVFKSGERNLLVDTGFNQPACLADLQAGIAELELDMHKTDIFITHYHSDHCGLISQIVSPGSSVYMSGTDTGLFQRNAEEKKLYWEESERTYLREGFPPDELALSMQNNPIRDLGDRGVVTITPIGDGDVIQAGSRTFRCVLTPGHSPGHMCLYEEATKIMVLGDHVLFDITPNITIWSSLPNILACYLNSLEKIKTFDVKLALPAHRDNRGKTFVQRVDELVEHHHERLEEVSAIVADDPGLTGYKVATRMSWSIRAKSWQEFPATQKWFAVSEALAHLDYLVANGSLKCREQNGIRHYE